jgi:hypothetical protein
MITKYSLPMLPIFSDSETDGIYCLWCDVEHEIKTLTLENKKLKKWRDNPTSMSDIRLSLRIGMAQKSNNWSLLGPKLVEELNACGAREECLQIKNELLQEALDNIRCGEQIGKEVCLRCLSNKNIANAALEKTKDKK